MVVDEVKFISKYHVLGEGILKATSFLKNIDFFGYGTGSV